MDLGTGEIVYREKGTQDEVGGDQFWNFIRENPKASLAFVHNHPTDGFLSSPDMQTLASNDSIKAMIATSNDGLKRIAYGNVKTSRQLYNVYEDDIATLRNQVRSGTIDSVDYPFELERLVIKNSIRDFANLGFWEVDGRA